MTDEGRVVAGVPDAFEYFFEKEWCDGRPVVPPTTKRLAAMLAAVNGDPEELIGLVPPLMAPATVRAITLHAVMAGCKPKYLPLVIGAMECLLEERFNLLLLQATTSAGAPLVLATGRSPPRGYQTRRHLAQRVRCFALAVQSAAG